MPELTTILATLDSITTLKSNNQHHPYIMKGQKQLEISAIKLLRQSLFIEYYQNMQHISVNRKKKI